MRRALAIAWTVFLVAPVAAAWPVLVGGKLSPVGACYPDHREAGLWWLAPPSPVIQKIAETPAVSFTEYRYSGTRATGDQGTFWGRGLLQFTLSYPENAPRLAAARAFLGSHARVEALVAVALAADVVWGSVAGDAAPQALGAARAEKAPPDAAGELHAWEERSFALPLSPESARLLEEAFARGAVALSVNVVAKAPAFLLPPTPEERDTPPALATVMVDAVPVTLDPARHPGAIRNLDLDATMAAGYTFLEVACSDFAEGLDFSDLAVVVVRVAARAVNGDTISQELRFDAQSASCQGVHFDHAVRLDSGYEVEVHRIYSSGRRESDGPRKTSVWTGFLDESRLASAAGSRLDMRLLY